MGDVWLGIVSGKVPGVMLRYGSFSVVNCAARETPVGVDELSELEVCVRTLRRQVAIITQWLCQSLKDPQGHEVTNETLRQTA